MSETTKKCQVEMSDGQPCGREVHDGKYCIFHVYWKDKDAELFQKKLDEIFKDQSLKTYDFTRFIFPERVVLPRRFNKRVIFENATFRGQADFNKAVFEDGADFSEATFDGAANFASAVFKGKAEFTKAVFNGPAYFVLAVFKDRASFSSAIFKRGANFQAAFWGHANFFRAAFEAGAYFEGAPFEGGADFSDTLFKGEADFGGAHFRDKGYFFSAVFKGGAYFWGATFEGKADFGHATFEDTLLINGTEHHKKTFKKDVDFRSVKFSKPERAKFEKLNLSRVRFLDTDLSKVHFTDVNWYRENGKGRNRVFDEVSPDPEDRNFFDYALVAQLYRRLRANYEENLRYSEAGDFYIGEMEMTRKAQTSVFKKLPLLFYKAISNYGESYYRPLCWIAAILLIFPLLFMFAGIPPVNLDRGNPTEDVVNYRLDFSSIESFAPTWEKLNDYYTCFLYSMSVFSFVRDKKYTTIDNCGRSLFVFESILSPVTLAFFLLALRRRFKR